MDRQMNDGFYERSFGQMDILPMAFLFSQTQALCYVSYFADYEKHQAGVAG